MRSSLVGDTILGVQSEPACRVRVRFGVRVGVRVCTRNRIGLGLVTSDPLVWFLHQRGCAIREILSHVSVLDYATLCSRKK